MCGTALLGTVSQLSKAWQMSCATLSELFNNSSTCTAVQQRSAWVAWAQLFSGPMTVAQVLMCRSIECTGKPIQESGCLLESRHATTK